jgi:hypothetical protein
MAIFWNLPGGQENSHKISVKGRIRRTRIVYKILVGEILGKPTEIKIIYCGDIRWIN